MVYTGIIAFMLCLHVQCLIMALCVSPTVVGHHHVLLGSCLLKALWCGVGIKGPTYSYNDLSQGLVHTVCTLDKSWGFFICV